MKKLPQAKWYLDVCQDVDNLLKALGIEGENATEIKTFALTLARDQFLDGNRLGIRWSRAQLSNSMK